MHINCYLAIYFYLIYSSYHFINNDNVSLFCRNGNFLDERELKEKVFSNAHPSPAMFSLATLVTKVIFYSSKQTRHVLTKRKIK